MATSIIGRILGPIFGDRLLMGRFLHGMESCPSRLLALTMGSIQVLFLNCMNWILQCINCGMAYWGLPCSHWMLLLGKSTLSTMILDFNGKCSNFLFYRKNAGSIFFAYLLLFLPPKRWGISLLFWRSERDDREIYASNFSIHQSYLIFLHTVEEWRFCFALFPVIA